MRLGKQARRVKDRRFKQNVKSKPRHRRPTFGVSFTVRGSGLG